MKKEYYIAEAINNNTGAMRQISMLATAPIIPLQDEINKCEGLAEQMLSRFVDESRDASAEIDRYHFMTWLYRYASLDTNHDNDKFTVAMAVVDKKEFKKFNKTVKNSKSFFFDITVDNKGSSSLN